MMKSLRYQMRYMVKYIGLTLLVMVISTFYMMLFIPDMAEGFGISYMISSWMMIFVFCFLYIGIFNTTNFPAALGCGATRKGWLQASFISRLAYTGSCIVLALFVVNPLAGWVSGQPVGPGPGRDWFSGLIIKEQPVLINGSLVPLFVAIALLMVSYGALVGYITARFSAKWMVILMLAAIGLGVALILIGFLGFGVAWTLNLLQSPWLPVGLVPLCGACEVLSWRVIRKISVKG